MANADRRVRSASDDGSGAMQNARSTSARNDT